MAEKNRVFTIGLDGGTFDLIRPWVKAGRLPNISKLMGEGTWGELETVIHPLTAPAWTSFMTGKNPGKHGIFDFILRKPRTYDIQLINALYRDDRTLWKILGEAGRKVGIINIPMNYPPEPVNGFLVSWMDAPGTESTFTYPKDLYSKIKKNIGEYHITVDFHVRLDKYVQQLYDLIENRYAAAEYLMDHHKWDFFIVLFSATDFAQHAFWKYMDKTHPGYRPEEAAKYGNVIQEVYERIDLKIGKFLKKLDQDTIVMTLSDHGAGPLKKVVNLNRWLYENGWLTPASGNGKASLKDLPKRMIRKTLKGGFSILKRNLPVKAKGYLRSLFPGIRGRMESYLLSSQINWSSTKAFALGAYGNIWINLKGREPNGAIEPGEEYETLCNEISERLLQLRDPDTDEAVVSRVYRRHELYHGEYIERAPDLIIRWTDYAYHSRQRFGHEENTVFESRQTMPLCDLEMNGYHRLNGMLILTGKDIRKNMEMNGAHIMDVAPTILYLMGIPVPTDMDGKVLTEAIEDSYIRDHPIVFTDVKSSDKPGSEADVYSDDEAELIKERLQKLGYID